MADYAEAMLDGAVFPPVTVFHDGESCWLADGYHRFGAAQVVERDEISAEVREGSKRDAILFAVGANAEHGWRRSNGDKRQAVLTLLFDEEWSFWSDREIAQRCRVHHKLVGKLRSNLTGESASENRTYRTKHGSVATMNTANIGKSPAKPAEIETQPAGEQEMVRWDPVNRRWIDPWAGEKRERYSRRVRFGRKPGRSEKEVPRDQRRPARGGRPPF